MRSSPKISAIIVALDEELFIEQIIDELKKQDYSGESEIILADGGSTDRTIELANAHNILIITSPKKGKAPQMNKAAQNATGDILFFVHADMQLPETVFSSIADVTRLDISGGGFANEFDTNNEKIKSLGTWLNFRLFDRSEQSDKGIYYGDNGIFVLKSVFFELNGFKEIPIMEDYDFSQRLNQNYKSQKIKNIKIIVSARRHIKAGFLKTRIQWVVIRKLYKLGLSPNILAKWYGEVR